MPKLFGYSNENLYRLAQGSLKKWTNGVEYYYGLRWLGVEQKPTDLPPQLIKQKLIKIIHAPFIKEPYPYHEPPKNIFNRFCQLHLISRAKPDPWQRLPQILELTKKIGVTKTTIHAVEIILASQSLKLFQSLNQLSRRQKLTICLENNVRTLNEQSYDQPVWTAAHNPIKLIQYLKENNLDNFFLTIDTAHLAASDYNVREEWQKIVSLVSQDINSYIRHFHLVDYDTKQGFQAAVLGEGNIGLDTFRQIIKDLYKLNYQGTISIEAAPLYFHQQKIKCFWNAFKRNFSPFKTDLQAEEEYLLRMIRRLLPNAHAS